jgi:hypothetical protein
MCFSIDTTKATPTSKKAKAYNFVASLNERETKGEHIYKGIIIHTIEGEYVTARCALHCATIIERVEEALERFFYECHFPEIKQTEKWAYELHFMQTFLNCKEEETKKVVRKVAESL